MRDRSASRIVTLLMAVAVMLAWAPLERAWGCSCVELTIEEVVEREPDAAVVRIRRIDEDGGQQGVGLVEEVLHGPQMPPQLPLDLDDGGSCRPWVAVGEVALLTFVPDGGGWRTMDCGRLHPAAGLDAVVPDPSASGDAAVVLAGRFPGAGVIVLDDHLRVLAVGDLDDASWLEPCGEHVVVQRWGPNGEVELIRLRLADLDVDGRALLSDEPEQDVRVFDVSCLDGRADVVGAIQGATPVTRLWPDVFGQGGAAEGPTDLPPAEDGRFTSDGLLLLRQSTSGAELVRHERDDIGTTGPVVRLPGVEGYEVSVAPDGAHAVVRGFAAQPVLSVISLADNREVAREEGWWQPVARPWLAQGRLLQVDENSGGIGDSPGLLGYRVVDLALSTVAELEATPAWLIAASNDSVVAVASDHISVLDGSGAHVRTLQALWAGAAHDVLSLGPVVEGGSEPPPTLPEVDSTVEGADASRGVPAAPGGGDRKTVGVAGMLVALVAGTALVLRRRRRLST